MGKTRHSVPVPNERLKQARLLRGWTQADVAGFLDTDGYTVNRWERGRAYPSLYFRRKLCDVFGKDAYELGFLPSVAKDSATTLSPACSDVAGLWSVPHPRNACFTGREEILQTLHRVLVTSRSAALVQTYALHGLGGVGKTQIALEYAYQRASQYSAVFWIEAETAEHIISSMLRIAEVLQLPEYMEADQQRIVAAVQRWLAAQSKWLLIWDNLENLNLLQRFLPPVRQGAILLTTRCQALGTLAEGVDLASMGQNEGVLFVLRRAKLLKSDATSEQVRLFATTMPAEYAAAEELVTVMGGLPLALDQAGAYLEETGCSLSDYLQRYKQQPVHLLNRRGLPGGGHPRSVATTFLLACVRVEQEQMAAADLLRVCSLLHADAIPEELFLKGAAHLGPELMSLATHTVQFDQALATLRNLSLVQRHAQVHTLSLHRLVQAVLQEHMSEEEHEKWLRRVTAALNATFPEVISDTWKRCERLLSHVLTVAAATPNGAEDQELASVLRKAADYLRERAQYEQARQLYQRILLIWEQVPGGDIEQAHALTGLALLAYEHGQYAEAEALYQQAMCMLELAVGPEACEVARPLTNLAILYKTLGRYAEAELFYRRAQHILEQTLGPEHLKVAHPLINLAEVYLEQGKYELVEPLCERSLAIWKQAVGARHSLIAYPLLTLAKLSAEQGNDEQAESLYRQAFSIWEQALGMLHPLMVEALNGLADIYFKQKKYAEAETLYQRGLRIHEQAFGLEHPDMVDALNGLANLYARQRKDEQARQLYQRALRIQEQHLGHNHPKTARILYDQALFCQGQGDLYRALSLMGRALQIRYRSLGATHPKTLATQTFYTQFLQTQTHTKGVSLHILPAFLV
jgi:tetratricopeptide (TPR) repeat protein/transcriptional regulator with XRE-family HTH domain